MDKRITMTAPELDSYKFRYHSNGIGNSGTALTQAGIKSLDSLLGKIEKIKPTYPDRRWEFWFSVPKGTLKQYIRRYKFFDPELSEEEFRKEIDEEYPGKRGWFKLGVINENGYVMVFLDDTIIVSRGPDMENDSFPNSDLDRILAFFNQVVLKTVDKLEKGTYNDYIEKRLPYAYRKGYIRRSVYWKLLPKQKKFDVDGLKRNEIDKFVKHVKDGNDLTAREAIGRYSSMAAQKYYEICSWCYAAAGFDNLDGKTPKEMFLRHGDSRDGGMSKLNETSEKDFECWFALSPDEKWKIENSSHMWEISCGHTHTMIHLHLMKDDRGYWFCLRGGTHCRTTEVVRMYNAMKDKGVPVLLDSAAKIKDKLLGNDDLGIIPNNEMGWRYWYGGFPKKDVINFVQLQDGNAEEVIKNSTWFDLNKVELAEK